MKNDKDGKEHEFSFKNCENHSKQIKKAFWVSYPDCKPFWIEKEIEFSDVSYACPLTNEPYNVKK